MQDPLLTWILAGSVVLLLLLVALRVLALKRRRVIVLPPKEETKAAISPAQQEPPPPLPELKPAEGPPDDLRLIKGIGPKLQTMLNDLGVTRFEQIAGWTPEEMAAIDARLGQFQGRPERDKWQEQARLLATGDRKAFERAHGKLGGEA
jgi:predicted flap endonuclease-1-like 5' DNA nuclease